MLLRIAALFGIILIGVQLFCAVLPEVYLCLGKY